MIIWGTKRVEKKLGRVADYCPMCREVRAFRLCKISMVGHIYYVGLGRGETIGHFGTCESCSFEMDVDPTSYAALARPRSTADTRQLVQQTFPDIRGAYAERLDLEAKLRSSPSSIEPEVRQQLIHEVLKNAAPAVEARYAGGTQLDRPAALALLATLVVPVVVMVVGQDAVGSDSYASLVPPIAGGLLVVGAIATLFYAVTANRRWMRSHILPMLARALRPLGPTEQELDQLLQKFRAADLRIGKKLTSQLVCQTLQGSRTVAPA